jgi:hypothetical protein
MTARRVVRLIEQQREPLQHPVDCLMRRSGCSWKSALPRSAHQHRPLPPLFTPRSPLPCPPTLFPPSEDGAGRAIARGIGCRARGSFDGRRCYRQGIDNHIVGERRRGRNFGRRVRRLGYVQKRGHNERNNYSYVLAADLAGSVTSANFSRRFSSLSGLAGASPVSRKVPRCRC